MSGGLDDADEVLEEVLLLLLHEAALDAESGLGEVLADVVLDALRPDAARALAVEAGDAPLARLRRVGADPRKTTSTADAGARGSI